MIDQTAFEMNTPNTDELIICPNSEDHWHHMAFSYVVHRASRSEIQANGGVCAACREKFKKNNSAFLQGKIETPANYEGFETREPYEQILQEVNHTAPEVHGITEFDYDEVDRLLSDIEETEPDDLEKIAEMFGMMLRFLWPANLSIRAAAIRFITLTAGIRPDLVDGKTYLEIAKQFGVTKASISKSALKIQDSLGIKFRNSRNISDREQMRAAQHKIYQSGSRKPKNGQLLPTTS